jgi:hypothetical protein
LSSIPFIFQLYKRAQNEKKNLEKKRDATAEDTCFFRQKRPQER